MIKISVRKYGPGFRGSVRCVINGKQIWSESSGITRITKEDAKSDAEWMKEQYEKSASL